MEAESLPDAATDVARVSPLMQGLCPAAAAALPGMLSLGNSAISPKSMLAPLWVGDARLLSHTDLGAVFLLFFSLGFQWFPYYMTSFQQQKF